MVRFVCVAAGALAAMPLTMKYLLLASYMAGANSKDSDAFTFGEQQRGRRKRSQAERQLAVKGLKKKTKGDDVDEDVDDNNNRGDDGGRVAVERGKGGISSGGSGDVGRLESKSNSLTLSDNKVFSLERLLGIFSSISSLCGTNALSIGDVTSLKLAATVAATGDVINELNVSQFYGNAQLFSMVRNHCLYYLLVLFNCLSL